MSTPPSRICDTNPAVQRPFATSSWFVPPPFSNKFMPRGGNDIKLLNCGEDYLPAFLEAINHATETIYIAIWGFDPDLPLVLDSTNSDDKIKKILKKKAKQGVQIKIMVWYNFAANTKNRLTGDQSHADFSFWAEGQRLPGFDNIELKTRDMPMSVQSPQTKAELTRLNQQWKQALRTGNHQERIRIEQRRAQLIGQGYNLYSMQEQRQAEGIPRPSTIMEEIFATHHQKMILIDHNRVGHEVGFVQGINFWSKYFDRKSHPYRSDGNRIQDIALRLKGPCLIDLFHNFKQSWNETTSMGLFKDIKEPAPEIAPQGHYNAQILRTWRESDEQNIYNFYLNALRNVNHFIYVEDQYFRMPEFAKALKNRAITIRNTCQNQKALHVFVITNKNELATGGVVARDAMLNELGRKDTNVSKEDAAKVAQQRSLIDAKTKIEMQRNGVIIHVCCLKNYSTKSIRGKRTGEHYNPAMLYPLPTYEWLSEVIYGDVYVHAKLTIFDNAYLTLGSANWNERSMVTDTELNIAVKSHDDLAMKFREGLWGEHLKGLWNSQDLGRKTMPEEWYEKWEELLMENLKNYFNKERLIMNLFPLYEDIDELKKTTSGKFG